MPREEVIQDAVLSAYSQLTAAKKEQDLMAEAEASVALLCAQTSRLFSPHAVVEVSRDPGLNITVVDHDGATYAATDRRVARLVETLGSDVLTLLPVGTFECRHRLGS